MRQDRDETKFKILYNTETRPRVLVPLVSEPSQDRDSHPLLVPPPPPTLDELQWGGEWSAKQ